MLKEIWQHVILEYKFHEGNTWIKFWNIPHSRKITADQVVVVIPFSNRKTNWLTTPI